MRVCIYILHVTCHSDWRSHARSIAITQSKIMADQMLQMNVMPCQAKGNTTLCLLICPHTLLFISQSSHLCYVQKDDSQATTQVAKWGHKLCTVNTYALELINYPLPCFMYVCMYSYYAFCTCSCFQLTTYICSMDIYNIFQKNFHCTAQTFYINFTMCTALHEYNTTYST